MRIGLGLCLPIGGGGVDYAALVQSILSGTLGFAREPIAANLFQDTAAATPVVNTSDPIGRVNCQWGSSPPNWQQGTAGYRPLWTGVGISYDGIDDHFATFSNAALLNNRPGAFHCERVLCGDLVAIRPVISFSTATATVQRFVVVVNTNGSIALQTRRLDADALNTLTTATGLITAGVAAVITAQVDWAGTGLAKIWLNGTEVASAAVSGSVANSEATDSNRAREGASLNAVPPSQPFLGVERRAVTAPFVMTAQNRAAIEAWGGAD
jgi:hypothetical protein